MPKWNVALKESVIEDLRSIGPVAARAVLKKASFLLAEDPQAETQNRKTLRPNPVAERELRLFGKSADAAGAAATYALTSISVAMDVAAGISRPSSRSPR